MSYIWRKICPLNATESRFIADLHQYLYRYLYRRLKIKMLKFSRFRFLRQALIGLLSFACVVTFAACGTSTPTSTGTAAGGSLKVATEPAFPPFESQAATGGGLEGFDIDLMNAIGEAAGLKVEFESLPFDGIIPALKAGTVDAAISAMTITAERAEAVSFSRPYFKAGLAIAVKAGDTATTSLDALKGKRIAVQIGTTGAAEAKKVPGAKITTRAGQRQCRCSDQRCPCHSLRRQKWQYSRCQSRRRPTLDAGVLWHCHAQGLTHGRESEYRSQNHYRERQVRRNLQKMVRCRAAAIARKGALINT